MSAEVSGNVIADMLSELVDLAAMAEEELDPELVDWVEDGQWGEMLRHPLVYMVPLVLPGHANRALRQKRELLARAEAEQDWHTCVWLHERPHRFNAMVEYVTGTDQFDEVAPARQEHADLVAAVWVDSENIGQHIEGWRRLLAQPGQMPDIWLGSDAERAEFEALPRVPHKDGPTIHAWRGGAVGDWSWTTDLDIAKFFSRQSGHPIRGHHIPVSDVFGYLTRRGEAELMVKFTEFRAGLVYP